MESQHQNPEFRIDPENFHPCTLFAEQMLGWTGLIGRLVRALLEVYIWLIFVMH